METFEVIFESLDDEDFIPDAKFILKNDSLSISVVYSQEGITQNQWMQLIEACKNNGSFCLTFLDSNGCIAIMTEKDKTSFNVSTYGGDNSGEMLLTIPTNLCINGFQQAYDTLVKYYKKKN